MSISISAGRADMDNRNCPAMKKRRLALSKWIGLQGANFLSLPEDVVSRITAEITLKEAVRMSAVCSKLRRAWIYHPNLDFDISTVLACGTATADVHGTKAKRNQRSGRNNRMLRIKKFIGTVNFMLREHSGFAVNRLAVKFELHNEHANDIDGWVSFAIASKARAVVLNFSPYMGPYKNNYSFPCHLFNNQNSGLQVLQLDSVTLDPRHDFSGFSNLTTLSLEHVLILQDLQYLLLKCPALEWLSIRRCPQLHNLHVAGPLPQLKFLRVHDCAINKIDLHAANLTTFEYRGGSKVLFALKECLKLKTASNAFHVEDNLEHIFTGLPNGLLHVETLHVEVTVETQMLCVSCCEYPPERDVITDHPHHNLKQACITGFNGNGGQVALVKYILRNAVQLERMAIDPRGKIIGKFLGEFEGLISAKSELVPVDRKGVLRIL